MVDTQGLADFGMMALFALGGVAFVMAALTAGRLLRPDRPNEEKNTSYECGEDPVGDAWGKFNIRFYIVALVFVLFDVELLFLFPWATVFGRADYAEATDGLWGWFALAEMGLFVGVLALGLAYAWRKGLLDWVRPQSRPTEFRSKVPRERYEELNRKY